MAEIIDFEPKPDKKRLVSEVWVARAFAERQAGKLAYCHDRGSWLRFDGSIWRPLNKPDVFHTLREQTAEMSAHASNADKMLKASFVAGVERFAKADPAFSREADDWDVASLAMGTPEGLVDLPTGELRPAQAADMLTKSTAVTPDEFEDCPRWLTFLAEATGGDDDLMLFLQRWCGYCLTGDVREQSLVFLWGDGGNGKGVFLNTIAAIMGDYAVKSAMETFTAKKFEAHPTELARLHGARLVYASETEEGRACAEARLKELTGGDPITARFMGKNFFTFRPAFKLTFMGNLQPSLATVDDAMKRRLCMAPFDKKPVTVDLDLYAKLKEEWPGILRWAINGCGDWLKHGLPRPAAVMGANEDYFADQDMVTQWLNASCKVQLDNEYLWERTSDLFASWCAFAKAAREPAGTVRGFSFRLQRLGFARLRSSNERRMGGIELIRRPDSRDD